mgnify:CR=1 FL=1
MQAAGIHKAAFPDTSNAMSLMAAFLGNWTVERHIHDQGGKRLGRFEGIVQFSRAGEHVCYAEEGLMQYGGQAQFKASRVYQWRFPGGARIEVKFADGRDFHSIDFVRGSVSASHFCAPDKYDVTYDFGNWPEWSTEWHVEGPRKAYRMMSIFRRAAPDCAPPHL